ncbi:MFS transporter [Streptomyces armeniacus]|nr:MFS transporter [Streptomyces armeniacus]
MLRWLLAYTASMVGDGVYFVALGWAAAEVAGPAQVGMVMAAGAVPRAVLMLGGGVAADRFGPRGAVLGSDAVRCAVILAVAAALAFASPGLWLLVAVALVFGAVDALFLPAVGALPPRLTGPDQLTRVQGMRALAIRTGHTAGPPLGGLAMGLGGTAAAFACAGGLFALSLTLLLAVRIGPLPAGPAARTEGAAGTGDRTEAGAAPGERATAWRELVDGLRYIRRHRLIGPLVVSGAASEILLNGPLNVGLVLLAAERGWGASGMGWIVSAFGAGAGAGALLITVRGRLPYAGRVQIGTLAVCAVTLGTVGLLPTLPAAMGAAGAAGLLAGVCGGLSQALILTSAAPSLLGRVTAVLSLSSLGLAPLSYPVFGAAAGRWGVGETFAACGALGLLVAFGTLLSPAVRAAELPRPAPGPARAPGNANHG